MMKKHYAHAKVTVRKQIAIPKKVQEKLGGLNVGEYVLFYEDGGETYIKKGAISPVLSKS